MKFIFTGGGTGGHVYPALAVADEVRKDFPDSKILFVGAKGKIEEKIVPLNNYELETIKISGIYRKNILKNVALPFKYFNALNNCKKILKGFKPDVVMGTGGYASAPMIYSAYKFKIPSLIQEGNAYPGIVTRYFSKKVNRVILSFEETKKYIKNNNNIKVISYPVRRNLNEVNKNEALKYFNLIFEFKKNKIQIKKRN